MWSAIISAIVGLVGAGANVFSQLSAQSQNQANFERQQNFTERTQQQVFEREDTQMQRLRNDAVAAGFSPLAALGQGTSDTVVSQPSSPGLQGLDMSGLLSVISNFALETRRMEMQEKLLPAQIANLNSQSALNDANSGYINNYSTAESLARIQHMESEVQQLAERINLTRVETETARSNLQFLLDTYQDRIDREKAEISALVAAAASDAANAASREFRNVIEEAMGAPIEVVLDPQSYATYLGARAVASVKDHVSNVVDDKNGGLTRAAQEVTDVLASPYRVQSSDSDKKHWWDRLKDALDNYFDDTVSSAMKNAGY